jgi:hypothetical protein
MGGCAETWGEHVYCRWIIAMTLEISFFNARRSTRLPKEKEGYNRIIVGEPQKKLS